MFRSLKYFFNSLISDQDNIDSSVEVVDKFKPAAGTILRPPRSHVLFLDIDGVLHVGDYATFSFNPILESILFEFPQFDVIISSNWKDSCSMDTLLEHFPESIRDRIVGATPTLPDYEFARHHEIMRIVDAYKIRSFVAIDDSANLFPPSCPYLFLTTKTVALTPEVKERFIHFLRAMLN